MPMRLCQGQVAPNRPFAVFWGELKIVNLLNILDLISDQVYDGQTEVDFTFLQNENTNHLIYYCAGVGIR